MKNKFFLSILTCTYNSEKHLQECIDSVVVQALEPNEFEHIFVNNNSTDKTEEIIKNYQRKYPQYNIRIIKQTTKGVYNAMNMWIREAKWKYLNMLNSDDYWEPGMIKKYINFIKETWEKEIYCGYNYHIFDQWRKEERHHKYMWKKLNLNKLLEYNPINHQAIFYQKSLHERFGMYEEKFKILSDYKFWLVLWSHNIFPLWYKKYVVNFRYSGMSQNPRNLTVVLREDINIKKPFISKIIYIKIKTNTLFYTYIMQYIICFSKYIGVYDKISPFWRKYILRK